MKTVFIPFIGLIVGVSTRSNLRAGQHVVYTIHGQSLYIMFYILYIIYYTLHSSPDSVPIKGATLVTITSSIGSLFGDRLSRDGLLGVSLR